MNDDNNDNNDAKKIDQHIRKVLGEEFAPVQKRSDNGQEGHKLTNFLDIEKNRIKQLKDFFQTRIPNVIELNQFDELMQELVEYNDTLRTKILKHTLKKDSKFNKNIKQIFNKTFID
ncbi:MULTISPECIES: hypothetical protein [Halobacteriovorax]|uniref:Uncharacterized protein n=1 Tax=Halobacteriovorax vibrionivorans TaxID=2152716 RepID=A0ABY0IES1_9BACT|nr:MULTISPECIES: hypothetical protein [Halobacteriovorax]AYF45027.1 hypothetical protein BALOs_2028 [Halobacteriovorax sp. BALOs_7]RZF21090.1 hypothetical protein DAY19_14010 [Halobacteriovorax vibrionivorans]TGD47024.1 hypothetical protein EP118_09645 [Halobacteriovorax sp. Y22]